MTNIQRSEWNKNADHPLQTWEWGEFRNAWGNTIKRFAFGQITIHKIPFTQYKIGIFDKGPSLTQTMIEELKTYAKKENLIFIKVEPNTKENKTDQEILKSNGAVPGKTLFTPSTFILNLEKNEDELLKSFHPKTRYNIRLAQKKGVQIHEDNSPEAFNKYWQLSEETTRRQGFFAHNKKYHELMWKYLHTDMVQKKHSPIAHLLTATYDNEIIVAWIIFVWKETMYYPYGASSDRYKNVMAPNLMMWEAIKFGKRLKLKSFDLWGREEGKGFTKFKEGYNPEIVKFLGTWDIICSPLYWPYRLADFVRWKFLRLKAKTTTSQ
jgi:lipid II:glycine glycyltransferase (peptidoglycan interpeptide bridge formation enzyme)